MSGIFNENRRHRRNDWVNKSYEDQSWNDSLRNRHDRDDDYGDFGRNRRSEFDQDRYRSDADFENRSRWIDNDHGRARTGYDDNWRRGDREENRWRNSSSERENSWRDRDNDSWNRNDNDSWGRNDRNSWGRNDNDFWGRNDNDNRGRYESNRRNRDDDSRRSRDNDSWFGGISRRATAFGDDRLTDRGRNRFGMRSERDDDDDNYRYYGRERY